MKGKAGRQSHKATNTFKFRGFGEKVQALRISARKYLLQRPKNLDGEDTTFLYEAINKARELNVTEQFLVSKLKFSLICILNMLFVTLISVILKLC